jgi:hypothetical protein
MRDFLRAVGCVVVAAGLSYRPDRAGMTAKEITSATFFLATRQPS